MSALPANANAALMDRIYRHQRHVYDLSRKFYLLGRDRTIDGMRPATGAAILEIGCGTGRNLIRIARRYPQAECYGLDVSAAMLETARAQIAAAGLSHRIRLATADATGFDPQLLFGRPNFDRILISYALSMIPPWQEVASEAARRLSAEGSLHIVDFGDQARLPGWFRGGLEAWLAMFHVSPRHGLPAALRAVASEMGGVCEVTPLYRGYAVQAVVQRG